MGVDLRDKLKPVGRLELLDDANQRVRAYYRFLRRSGRSRQRHPRPGKHGAAQPGRHPARARRSARRAQDLPRGRRHPPANSPEQSARRFPTCASGTRDHPVRASGDGRSAAGGRPAGRAGAPTAPGLAIRQRLASAREPGKIPRMAARRWRPVGRTWPTPSGSRATCPARSRPTARPKPSTRRPRRGASRRPRQPARTVLQRAEHRRPCWSRKTIAAGGLESFRRGADIQQKALRPGPEECPVAARSGGELSSAIGRSARSPRRSRRRAGAIPAMGWRSIAGWPRRIPTNTDWQSDLFVTQLDVGDISACAG